MVLTLWRLHTGSKFHGGENFDIILTLWRLQVSLKFHGGENFDIILTLWTLQVSLKFHGVGICITSCSCGGHVSYSSAMGAGIAWRKCSCRVAQSGQRSCTSRVAQSWELRNLSKAIAQAESRNPTSCASRAAQSWKLRKRSCAILGVAQAKFRNARYPTASPKRTLALSQQHSDNSTCSGTLQRQPATKLQSANSTLTAAPCSGTLLLGQQPSSKTQARNPTKELRNLSCAIRRSYRIGLYSTPTGQVSDPSLVAVQSWTLHRQKVADDHPPGPLSSPATRESNSPPPMPLAVL